MSSAKPASGPTYRVIWHTSNPGERPWIEELFGGITIQHIYDPAHQLVTDNAILIDGYLYYSSPAGASRGAIQRQ